MDLDAGHEVWNYPVYGYRVEYQNTNGNQYRGTITLWYADDAVPPSFVGTKVGIRRYLFSCQMRGGVIVAGSARWEGGSIKDHPDFAWSPYLVRPENPHIDHGKVLEMLKRSKQDGQLPKKEKDKNKVNPPKKENPEDPITSLKEVLSPNDLLGVVARPSDWAFSVHTEGLKKQFVAGQECKLQVRSEKGGYLYLIHFDSKDNISLIYPASGDDNKIKGDAERKGPVEVRFECPDTAGLHRVKAVVTSRPLRFTGLYTGTGVGGKKDKKQIFHLNPTTKKMIKEGMEQVEVILEKPGKKKEERQEEAARFVSNYTGGNVTKMLGHFAQSETTFYIGPGKKGGNKE